MTSKGAVRSVNFDENKEIEALRRRLAELEGNKNSDRIPLDEYIPVMSLIPFRLNLSTKEAGGGDVKKFSRFGEVKNILYKDLVDIMESHPNFVEAGYFYILNPKVIRQHGLDEVYSTILTKEKIEEILLANSEKSIELYKTANKEQQNTIVLLLIERLKTDPNSVNLNIVDRLSRECGVDISKKANDAIELEKDLADLAETSERNE